MQNALLHPYQALTPEVILTAVEKVVGPTTGAVFALNSYENRVYQVALEEGPPFIVKFYRPERWSEEALLEEHAFAQELYQAEVAVVPPLAYGKTLFTHAGFFYALYPKEGGRPFEVQNDEDLREMGRLIARLHNVASIGTFTHRPTLTVESFGIANIPVIGESELLPPYLKEPFLSISTQVLDACVKRWSAVAPKNMRLHGDCHVGNILTREKPFLVDLDDCLLGPAMQDVWMFLPGEEEEAEAALNTFIEGYTVFRDFPYEEKALIEVLRTLRMLHYTAWVVKRWHDPSFPRAFPFFKQPNYWQELINNLQQQLSRLL